MVMTTINSKYNLTQINEYDTSILRGNIRNLLQTELKLVYSEPLKVSTVKFKDLVSLCQSNVILSEYHEYFKSLPHHESNVIELHDSDAGLE